MKSTGYMFLLMGMFALVIESKLLKVGCYRLIYDMPSQNLKIHNDMIYIGVRNKILSLKKDLELVNFYNTCKSGNQEGSCNNKNKVLILNNEADQLIVCGTGLDGVCELLGLPDFKIIKGANGSSLSVSVDINSPTIGVITRNGNLTIAVTNGPSAPESHVYDKPWQYAISKRMLSNLELWSGMHIKMKPMDTDFVVKYKDGFQHKNYIYFVTNQNFEKNGVKKMISKLVRLCEDDENFKGYVDIEIGCMDNDGSEYNLIQHIMKAETVSGDVWFVGIFSKSDNSDGDSVMCATKLTDVNQVINSTWQNFITCKNETRLLTRAYFIDERPKSCIDDPAQESEYSCDNKLGGKFFYNIGVQKLYMTLKDALKSTAVTTAILTGILDGRDNSLKGNNPVMILGTSTGNLHFYNLKINKEEFTVSRYLDYYLGGDVPVTGIIQEDEDFLYVLSETMLYKLTSTNCSEFGSCQRTMNGINPLCGWCVLQNKATRRGQCTSGVNHWLSALDGRCPSFTSIPKGVKFGTTVPIVLNLKNVPKQDGDVYKCIFTNNSSVLGTVDATPDGDNIKCQSPNVNVHVNSNTKLELSLSGNIIASQPFIFYECQQFTKCGDCVSTVGVDCKWNRTTLECGTTGVNNISSCPALSSNVKYIPSDVKENLILNGSNLEYSTTAGHKFKCQIGGKCFNAVLVGTNITCQNVEISTNISKSEKPIKVKVGLVANVDCSAMKDMDDEHSNKVIVYDCGKLVNQDCSKCCALNKTRYKCNWINGECQYSTSTQCNDNSGCPKPIIDQLKPSDGPFRGGTVITLTGKHFGIWSEDQTSVNSDAVKVDDSQCTVSGNKDDYNVHPGGDNTDYLLPFPTRIVCTVPQINGEMSNYTTMVESDVTLQVKVLGPTSDPKQFTYKKPTFANIKPVKGMVAGKTRIFITGKHLSIGNKKIIVNLNKNRPIECTDVGTTFYEGSMTISCLTGSVKEAGRYKVNVVMDGNVYTTNLNFTYTANATIDGISPTKGFASGGTRITVTGKGFENVQKKCIVLKFFSYKKETCCSDIKPGVLICTVPAVSEEQRNAIMKLSNKTRKKRSIDDGCFSVGVVLQLDGLKHDFNIKYCRDPELDEFNDGVLLFGSDDREIKIKGDYLTLVAAKDDFNVTVGVADCPIISLEKDEITCLHSHKSEDTHPDVNVTVGNIRKRVGHIQYQIDVNNTFIIAGAAAAGVVFLIGLVVFCVCCLYKRVIRKKRKYKIQASEMKIIDVPKQDC